MSRLSQLSHSKVPSPLITALQRGLTGEGCLGSLDGTGKTTTYKGVGHGMNILATESSLVLSSQNLPATTKFSTKEDQNSENGPWLFRVPGTAQEAFLFGGHIGRFLALREAVRTFRAVLGAALPPCVVAGVLVGTDILPKADHVGLYLRVVDDRLWLYKGLPERCDAVWPLPTAPRKPQTLYRDLTELLPVIARLTLGKPTQDDLLQHWQRVPQFELNHFYRDGLVLLNGLRLLVRQQLFPPYLLRAGICSKESKIPFLRDTDSSLDGQAFIGRVRWLLREQERKMDQQDLLE